ncbi:hypothetical protein EBAPG3_005775 [Nitrosospira lacus]|uniref:Lysozyme inhibitor LprI N-terminal domain-containing protein n=1 Tax=Nitrosospira lacus TaxID=1288494 RepID=A0A1W6SNC0_9PROT|nr:hypothetical protein [Nitrosospira lacus]ARO87318.1 hypothetical protein EBAPG3_005775 [Nitrosospira lacus]
MRNGVIKVLLLVGAMLTGFPVFAQGGTGKDTLKIDVSCIQNAIDERDTALATMVDTWSSSVKSALETRRDLEKASWNITSYKERRIAQRKAWSDYGKALRNANTKKKKERVSAWKKFDHDRKECDGAYSPEMNTGSTYDANL